MNSVTASKESQVRKWSSAHVFEGYFWSLMAYLEMAVRIYDDIQEITSATICICAMLFQLTQAV